MFKTINDYRSHFFFNRIKNHDVTLKNIGEYANAHKLFNGKTEPEDCALNFYLLSHAFKYFESNKDKNDLLNENEHSFMSFFLSYNEEIFLKSFLYLLSIVNKESRHIYISNHDKRLLKRNYGQEMYDYTKMISKKSREKDYKANKAISSCKDLPNVPLYLFLEHIEDIFSESDFEDSYGGEPWANITKCLKKYIDGFYSPEIMVDTMWSLSHNSGCIFDKDVIFFNTKNDGETLQQILNSQALGLIPPSIDAFNPYIKKQRHIHVYHKVKKLFPEIFETEYEEDVLQDMIIEYA